jgi:hypothetical protein
MTGTPYTLHLKQHLKLQIPPIYEKWPKKSALVCFFFPFFAPLLVHWNGERRFIRRVCADDSDDDFVINDDFDDEDHHEHHGPPEEDDDDDVCDGRTRRGKGGGQNRPQEKGVSEPPETEETETELRPAVAHTESNHRPEV